MQDREERSIKGFVRKENIQAETKGMIQMKNV